MRVKFPFVYRHKIEKKIRILWFRISYLFCNAACDIGSLPHRKPTEVAGVWCGLFSAEIPLKVGGKILRN
jgi:hypothetical protein